MQASTYTFQQNTWSQVRVPKLSCGTKYSTSFYTASEKSAKFGLNLNEFVQRFDSATTKGQGMDAKSQRLFS